jgi:chemotaxis protein methyltransferase CheR/type IV pilus assembly protein PilK
MLNKLQNFRSFGITATDISLPVLTKAREGIYNARKLLDLKSELIDRYFEALDGNKFKIKPPLKNKVCFSMANMINIEKSPLRNMDVIYCQNVLIYFRKECKHRILDSLVERLAPGGLLIIGQGEALGWHNSFVSRVPDNQTLAYIRQTTQEH